MSLVFIPDIPFFLEFAPNLGRLRNIDWSLLTGRVFEETEDFDLAIHAADLAYLVGVNPETGVFGEMTNRYKRTFS